MKKLISIVILLCYICTSAFASVFSYTFNLCDSDFNVLPFSGDSLLIRSLKSPATYLGYDKPCLPLISRSLILPTKSKIINFHVNYNSRLFAEDVMLNNTLREVPSSKMMDLKAYNSGYDLRVYPDSVCKILNIYEYEGLRIANFLVSPFEYDSQTRELFFIDSIQIDLEFEKIPYRVSEKISCNKDKAEIIQSLVENSNDYIIAEDINNYSCFVEDDNIEYLIITSESLRAAFEPLAEWKRKKGVPSKIITTEEIVGRYSYETPQGQIKLCLKDLSKQYPLRFVLLGGDIDIVPSQLCYAKNNGYIADSIPTDLYYSALEDLDWDTNKNGRAGELGFDKFSSIPQLDVTRAPVRTTTDAEIFVNRVIEYETCPTFKWEMFQAGTILGGRDGVTGESLADMLFKNVFENKIITGATKLFDTMAGSEALSIPKFTESLGAGFHYAEIISHGLVDNYVNHHGTSFFNTTQASDFVNKGHTLITTMACFTNSFDIKETNENPNPCMSEAFFRNPRSGVIGYLGSSREGWYNSSLDYSMAYENEFYQRLLYPELQPKNKNFGSLVSYTKRTINPLADSEFVYRWLHLCINALGDPETPVFSKTPRNFNAENVSAHYNSEGVLEINTGSQETRVCVSSSRNNNYYEVDFGATTYFDTGFGNFDVWVTQQDYIPFHISVSKMRPLDVDSNIDNSNSPEILSVTADSNTGNATIRCKFSKPEPPTISLYITSVDNGMTYLYTLNERNSEQLNINIDGFKRGFYILELNEGGIWSNPFRFVVK